jgi:hypothetical protein
MAKSKTPAVRQLRYEITNSATPGTETSHYVDIARDLSAINRRMMEQGRVYHVSKITVVSRNTIPSPGQEAGFISVSAAPNSWVVRGAAKFGKKMFLKMQEEALKGSAGDQRGRYEQFIVRSLEAAIPNPTYLVPKDNGGNNLALGEWSFSRFHSPDGTTSVDDYSVSLLGAHNGTAGSFTAISLCQSFGDTRATVTTNDPVAAINSDDPLANLFDAGTQADEIIEDMGTRGDDPPYSVLAYPGAGSNMPKPIVMQHGTLGSDGRVTLGGFEAVHGLIELEASSPVASDVYSVLVELKAGSYKGIAAEAL